MARCQDDSGYITREEVANVSLHVLPKTVLEKVTVAFGSKLASWGRQH